MGHSLNRTSFRINQNLVIDDKTFNPGYILISDVNGNVSWQNPSQYISNEEPLDHFIGELYGGGIVVAVWREQRETLYETCLISSVKNLNNYYFAWSATNNLSIGATARSHTFGASNSYSIISQNNTVGYAATECYSYINEDLYGLGVYGDWYLPSTFELNCLANNAAIVDRVIYQYGTDKSLLPFNAPASKMTLFENRNDDGRDQGNGYWTSTEFNSGSAYYLNLGSEGGARFATASKSLDKMVRPFRQDIKRWNGITWVQDRNKTGKILITYDQVVAGDIDYTNEVIANITAVETSLGNTVSIIATYSSVPSNLSMYDHIWDVGIMLPGTQTLLVPTGVSAKYDTYLKQGGAIFILGENRLFPLRNNDLASFITGMGGGTVTYDPNFPRVATACDVQSEFLLANSTSTVTFNAIGRFSSIGTGATIVKTSEEYISDIDGSIIYPIGTGGNAVVWKTGSLSQAPKGAIAVVLDINFLLNITSNNSSQFVQNLSQILNKS